jgi:hypothetical protein
MIVKETSQARVVCNIYTVVLTPYFSYTIDVLYKAHASSNALHYPILDEDHPDPVTTLLLLACNTP